MIAIRPAVPDDAAAISAIACEVQALHAAAWPSVFKPASATTFPADAIAARLAAPGQYFVVASLAGAVTGYLYAVRLDQPETAWKYAATVLAVEQMGVRADCRGRGVGGRLLEAARALAEAHGIADIRLSVWAFNDGARRFYERHGYAVDQEQRRLTLPGPRDRVP